MLDLVTFIGIILTIFIENGENDVNDMVTKVNVSYSFGHVFQSGCTEKIDKTAVI